MIRQLLAMAVVAAAALAVILLRLRRLGGRAGDLHVSRGHQAFGRGDFVGAVAEFERALALRLRRHDRSEVLASLGNAYEELGELDSAEEAHRKALQLSPDCFEAWNGLGIALRQKGELDEAEGCYLKALRLKPDYAYARASLGALYIFKDDPQKAIQSLERAVKLDAQIAVAHANLALAYAMVARFDEADESLRRAVVRGYRNAEEVKRRVDDLRKLAGDDPPRGGEDGRVG